MKLTVSRLHRRICSHSMARLAILITLVAGFGPGLGSVGTSVAQSISPQLNNAQSGYYRLRVGGAEVIALSDGTVPFAGYNILKNTSQADVNALLDAADAKPPFEASMNAYLIVLGKRLILIDAGTGELLGPTLNKLPFSLRAAGYSPSQITDILLTHIHADHSGGLMDVVKTECPQPALDRTRHLFGRPGVRLNDRDNPVTVRRSQPLHDRSEIARARQNGSILRSPIEKVQASLEGPLYAFSLNAV